MGARGENVGEAIADDPFGVQVRKRDGTAVGLGADVVAMLVDVHHRRSGGNRYLRQEERDLVARGPIEVERTRNLAGHWASPSREKW